MSLIKFALLNYKKKLLTRLSITPGEQMQDGSLLVWTDVSHFQLYQAEGEIRVPVVTEFSTLCYSVPAQNPGWQDNR